MNDDLDLRELNARSYPLAAAAISRHGLRWTGERQHIDALDWPSLLVTLHDKASPLPGPIRCAPTPPTTAKRWRGQEKTRDVAGA